MQGPAGSSQARSSRRDFLHVAAAAATTGTVVRATAAPADVNGRIRIGFIGPGGQGFNSHVKNLARLRHEGLPIDLVAVCDVYSHQADKVATFIQEQTGTSPKKYVDHRELLADPGIDAVTIATPDHWHHRQIVDSLRAGKHVYAEKPMTKTVEEALDVLAVWKQTGRVMQVGVQSTSLEVWDKARALIDSGKLGKVLGYQTEYCRNSALGQWRNYVLEKEMTPQTIDWRRWLGVEEGLAPEMPFDRALYKQWRCYWPFGSGMFTDLFVHRTTAMLKATGLRFPARVVGAGGIFLELDTRDVPDVATVIADYDEGCQGLINGTMANENSRIKQVIRGHFGAFEFGNGESFTDFRFLAERPQVTLDGRIRDEVIPTGITEADLEREPTIYRHLRNWVEAVRAEDPGKVNNAPDLGAAAVVTVILGAMSYRNGKVYHFDAATGRYGDGSPDWARKWEALSDARDKPRHVPGWHAGDTGSLIKAPEHQKLAGPWIDGRDPAAG
jgi:predicted dehydrogenase